MKITKDLCGTFLLGFGLGGLGYSINELLGWFQGLTIALGLILWRIK